MGSERAPSDLRSERRQSRVVFVWYKVISDESENTEEGLARSCDISQGGIGIVATRALQVGKRVFLEIGLQKHRVSAVGRVRYCAPEGDGQFRLGFALDIVPPTDRQVLALLLEE